VATPTDVNLHEVDSRPVDDEFGTIGASDEPGRLFSSSCGCQGNRVCC
jgi:hypothetical protein